MSFSVRVLALAQRLRPLLLKVLPHAWLRKAQGAVIAQAEGGLAARPLLPLDKDAATDGVNLVGYIRAEMGLGQAVRLCAEALDAAEVPFTLYDFSPANAMSYGDSTWAERISDTLPYNTNVINLNPPALWQLFSLVGREMWDKRRTIGVWVWELESIPDEWTKGLALVDELWAPSEFVCQALRKATDKPVYRVPHPAKAEASGAGREAFGLPADLFLVLAMFDSNSVAGRKNPLGAIRAFRRAFGEDDGVGIVIKANYPSAADLQMLRDELVGLPHVFLFVDTMPKQRVDDLTAVCDVFLSLHRAEGFGLVLAEAMLLGTPCVATNWSGNTDFMTADTACLVGYDLVTLREDVGVYPAGARWAEPDIEDAAGWLRRLRSDVEFRDAIAANAHTYAAARLAPAAVGVLIRERLGLPRHDEAAG
jgi:glycosyltransferase involved in cell wall biosynthesis